ncbi:GNAT family N-acetyltransferase [Dyella sp. C11]|uniref:GNAT family N-acetyltransferase n=1 Tax=Dyella sp. C11 TaxID=2126991 RepID=UPI000D6512A7|nr:GNAT family N-acetyltransferase [Dyella sp. C11]
MIDHLTIRRAGRADVAALMAICAEHAAFERLPGRHGERADALADALEGSPPALYAWLACVNDAIVGYASATVDFSTLDRARFLHMDCLYVRAAWRNRAVGRALWQHVHAQAMALDCIAVQWQTPAWNDHAARFYRRLGASESAKLRYVLPLGVA